MKSTAIVIGSLLCCLTLVVQAQNPAVAGGTAVVSGRITAGNQPLPGVYVVITPTNQNLSPPVSGSQSQAVSATTDAEGRYKLTSIAAGQYRIYVHAPVYVLENERRLGVSAINRALTVDEGETIENVDFSLVKGGVITGKVTNTEGRPAIAMPVFYFKVDQNGKFLDPNQGRGSSQWETDDRGIYRVFGLEPGLYKVAAGLAGGAGMMRIGAGVSPLRRSFHPDVTDESQAKVIEVASGGEVEDVDIVMSRGEKGYAVSGRVIDAQTGAPISGTSIGYRNIKMPAGSLSFASVTTNSRGEFRIEGLTPSGYSAVALNFQGGEMYSDPVSFEISNGDVSGLEIKMLRGATISGVVVLEGAKDPTAIASLSKLDVGARVISDDPTTMMGLGGRGSVGPDGTFKLTGVRPGKNQIFSNTFAFKGLTQLRTEYNGAVVNEIEVNPGDHLTGVRLIFTYGSGVIAGRVEVKGGSLPPGAQMTVLLMREGENQRPVGGAQVDARGQFVIEGVAQGTYKITVNVWNAGSNLPPKLPKVDQIVSVAGSGRQEVLVTIDLSKKEEDK